MSGRPISATRYGVLHDVLRDACPDSWGRLLIQREHGLADSAHPSAYLLLASNADRWGALAIGKSPKPSITKLSTPKLAQLPALSEELRSEEHTSELQSLMRISYAVFCLKKKNRYKTLIQ